MIFFSKLYFLAFGFAPMRMIRFTVKQRLNSAITGIGHL
jgi:hypothetical protein